MELRLRFLTTLAVLWLCFAGQAQAVEYQMCFKKAAERYNIDEYLLMAIAKWESNYNPNAVNRKNRDGSEDYGVMMINSTHLGMLKKAGYEKKDLFDPCTNIQIGAYILHNCIRIHGNTWRAVGAYNAGPGDGDERARKKYVRNIQKTYASIKGHKNTQQLDRG